MMLRVDDHGEPVLVGGRSASSGQTHFPLAEVCPYTGARDVSEVDLPRTGTLWAWTAVTAAPPGYHGPVPYGFGVVELESVELEDGLRVVTRLTVADPDQLTFGQPMRLVTEELPAGPSDGDGTVVVWAFAPERSG